jgi:hypothetical protein
MLLYMFRTLLFPSSGAFHHCTCSLWLPCGVVLVASSSTVLLILQFYVTILIFKSSIICDYEPGNFYVNECLEWRKNVPKLKDDYYNKAMSYVTVKCNLNLFIPVCIIIYGCILPPESGQEQHTANKTTSEATTTPRHLHQPQSTRRKNNNKSIGKPNRNSNNNKKDIPTDNRNTTTNETVTRRQQSAKRSRHTI